VIIRWRCRQSPASAREPGDQIAAEASALSLAGRPFSLALVGFVGLATIASTGAAAAEMSAPVAKPGHAMFDDLYARFIAEASQRFGVPTGWIRTIMRVESGGVWRAISPRGALGLMQIMPATWVDLRARLGLGADPFDPHDNIMAGTAYLAEMYVRYGMPGALAAYNAGPGRWEAFHASARPLPSETIAYVAAIAPMIGVNGLGGSPEIVRVANIADAPLSPIFVSLAHATNATAASGDARRVNDLTVVEAQVLGWASGVFDARRTLDDRPTEGASAADQANAEHTSPPLFVARGFRAVTR